MKATCLIADDEPLAIQLLEKYVNDSEMLTLSGTCSNALEVFAFLNQKQVDLLFLDIQMPKLTGLELLRVLRNPPAVIITTAHREYALEGYEFEIIDYLLKPITFDRYMVAVERFFARKKSSLHTQLNVISSTAEKLILLKSGTKTQQINTQAVLYIESLKDYIKIHFDDGKNLMLKYKIGQLEHELSSGFIRVHKSFIVNKNKVTSFSISEVELGHICLPVGHMYKSTVEMFLKR